MVGYETDAKNKHAYQKQAHSIEVKSKSLKTQINHLVNYMQKEMSDVQLDGFIKLHKLKAAGVTHKCVTKGTNGREQWNTVSTICKAIAAQFPEDPKACQQMVLQEVIAAFPDKKS